MNNRTDTTAMKLTTLANRIAQVVVATSAVVAYFGANAVTWPSTPLGATTNATPMTMIVMGKDHKLFYEAYNDASDVDGDGTLDIRFKPAINYYGLFDSSLCYNYASNLFSPGGTTDNLGRCTGTAQWSGRWLNYVTTTRIDALRKVLYGGHREVDTTSQTILRRAYIPQDAHSWGKEYHNLATDGYRIDEYTPFAQPTTSDHRHFFGSLTETNGINCATLNNCSDARQPLLRARTNVGNNHRIWEWASKERPVLHNSLSTGSFPSGTPAAQNYSVRVEVCTATFNAGCKQYPNGGSPIYKPVGLLHDYGENENMYFGLLTGSYNRPMSGGRMRKVVSSFGNEVNNQTGQFTVNARIVNTINNLRIRDFNNGRTDNSYRSGWVTTRAMNEGEFADWGNPIGEMLYEATRYFAGSSTPTVAFGGATTRDEEVGLSSVTWDDPYAEDSAASAASCARANFLTISDVNPSFDSDQLPGSYFGTFTGDLAGLNVETIGNTVTSIESNITGMRFIGQSDALYDTAPTPKNVTSLGRIRGLAPEEPTKQGSYYSASVAKYAKETDLRPAMDGKQSVDNYVVALSSPLPKIEVRTSSGRLVTIVPFAKSVSGSGISNAKGSFQPTNQIVDFYVERIVNSGAADADASVNSGRYYAEFQINFEDVEQGADHDMDAIAKYVIQENALGQVEVTVTPTYEAGGIGHSMGYIVSGSSADGIYLVAKDNSGTPGYFLNVRPGQAPGDCDQTPMPAGCGALPFANPATGSPAVPTYTFTPSNASAATLLKDPLWYAAKYGGYVDRNNNGILDQTSEWDQDGDGVPDTYFFVQNPLALKDSLKKAFDNIIDRAGSGGNVVANSTNTATDTFVFQGLFNSEKWSGDLVAYQVQEADPNRTENPEGGVASTPSWRAANLIPVPGSRRIYFGSMASGNLDGTEFQWNQLSTGEQALLDDSADILNYLRGVRDHELQNGGTLRDRNPTTVLGDIAHSSPFYLSDTNSVFIGANDGMLHAFDSVTGIEQFAYIPSSGLDRLGNLSDLAFDQSHEFFVDGDIAVSNRSQTAGRNYLVSALGRGGKGLFGLDVTDPANFDGDDVLWEYFPADDADLGFMLGRPVIAQLQNGTWAVIIGNGYNSTSQQAALYVFNLSTGALIRKLVTGVAGDNGLATPGLILDSTGRVTTAYAGDLKGNVWKFNLSSSAPAEWSIAHGGQPLFTATSSGGVVQPITAPITLTLKTQPEYADDPHVGRWFVHFGTGSDFQTSDPSNTELQSWYGLVDTGTPILRSELLQTPGLLLAGEVAGRPVRTFRAIDPEDMEARRGWVVDLTVNGVHEGERMVTASRFYSLANPTLIASSVIPVEDVCKPSGRGYLNAVNPFTGGRLASAFFDVDGDGDFTNDTLDGIFPGSIDVGVGKPGEAVLIGRYLVVGGSKGEVGDVVVNRGASPTILRGRISWREIVR